MAVSKSVGIPPRLLTRKQAATYCGVSVPTLMLLCPVKPIALGNRKRLERYDVRQLDGWIDTFGGEDVLHAKDWLAALDGDNDDCACKGN